MHEDVTEKAALMKACLIGTGLGDALGFHVEGKKSEDVAALIALMEAQGPEDFPLSSLRGFPLSDWITGEVYKSGQISDDTQMSLRLARAYACTNGREAFTRLLVEGFNSGSFVGYGYTTRDAVRQIAAGKPLSECGLPSGSNGAAMRVAPLAVLISDRKKLVKKATEQALLTHAHPDSVQASVAQALAVRLALEARGNAIDAAKFIDALEVYASGIAGGVRRIMDLSGEEARAHVLLLDRRDTPHQNICGLSSYGPPCVLWAIYSFLQTPESTWQTILRAISIGGDTDTVAAMAGALSGVYNGMAGMPSWAQEWLHDRGQKPNWDVFR